MSKLLLFNFLFVLLSCHNKQEKKKVATTETQHIIQEQNINNLGLIDYENFCNKPISELLKKTSVGNYNSHYFIDEPPFKLSKLVLTYNSRTELYIYTGDLLYQDRMNYDMKWSFDLIKKEEYKRIELYSSDSLLLRCDCKKERK